LSAFQSAGFLTLQDLHCDEKKDEDFKEIEQIAQDYATKSDTQYGRVQTKALKEICSGKSEKWLNHEKNLEKNNQIRFN